MVSLRTQSIQARLACLPLAASSNRDVLERPAEDLVVKRSWDSHAVERWASLKDEAGMVDHVARMKKSLSAASSAGDVVPSDNDFAEILAASHRNVRFR